MMGNTPGNDEFPRCTETRLIPHEQPDAYTVQVEGVGEVEWRPFLDIGRIHLDPPERWYSWRAMIRGQRVAEVAFMDDARGWCWVRDSDDAVHEGAPTAAEARRRAEDAMRSPATRSPHPTNDEGST